MIIDIHGGLTNNVFMGAHYFDEYGDNYWYYPDGESKYLEIDEAWAEFFSAMIRIKKEGIDQIKEFFPTATIKLDEYADKLLEELRKQ